MATNILPQQRAIDNCDGLPTSRPLAKARGTLRYYTGRPCSHGHLTPRRTSNGKCLACARIERAKSRVKKHFPRNPRFTSEVRRKHASTPLIYLFQSARQRAKIKGMEFSIGLDDVFMPEECPCCGIPFGKLPNKIPKDDAMSLDRINNDVGYVVGNVAILCWGCNRRKGTSSVRQLRVLVEWMEKMESCQL